MKDLKAYIVILVLIAIGIVIGYFLGTQIFNQKTKRPLRSFLVAVDDPNWIINYGDDLESRLVYNVALLNEVVNRQGQALKRLLEDPNR